MFWITCFIYPVLNKCIYYTFIAWTALKLNDQFSNMWMLFIYFQIWDFEHCESEEKNKMEEVKEVGVKKKKRRRAEGKYFSLSLGDVFSLISDFLFCFFFYQVHHISVSVPVMTFRDWSEKKSFWTFCCVFRRQFEENSPSIADGGFLQVDVADRKNSLQTQTERTVDNDEANVHVQPRLGMWDNSRHNIF